MIPRKYKLFFHTIRFLRWEQIWFRIYYRFFSKPKCLNQAQLSVVCSEDFVFAARDFPEQSLFGNFQVNYLGVSGKLVNPSDWNSTSKSKLWLYNAHYFDDLNAVACASREHQHLELINRWITENPPVYGNGWEPYPMSLRIVNWIKWLSRQTNTYPEILKSLEQQSNVLSQQLEYHILGNHLFANAKALVFSGVFLKTENAAGYLKKGLQVLAREIEEQFLSDGGHFERSPMYHCILLWDILDLIHLAEISLNKQLRSKVEQWKVVVSKALVWLKVMTHPDGEISFFNDSAIGVAASLAEIESYAKSCGITLENDVEHRLDTLADSGYSRITMQEHVAIFDHGPIGPGYLPGHAHADTLSIEWSVSCQRVLVNSGTSLYGISHERSRQRKTAAHNTVELNGEDSSEVWGGFRVARRAQCVLEDVIDSDENIMLVASHDGYKRLPGKPIHRRKLTSNNVGVEITDEIEGAFQEAYSFYHLHPDVEVNVINSNTLRLGLLDGKQVLVTSTQDLRVEASTWHPEFGATMPNKRIAISFKEPQFKISFHVL